MHREILLYDDDSQAAEGRRLLLGRVLKGEFPKSNVFVKREELLRALQERKPTDWVIGLFDLEDRNRTMRGAHLMRTIREHPELHRRCVTGALTVHVNPAMCRALDGIAFAAIAFGRPDGEAVTAAGLEYLSSRNPGERRPQCRPFPLTDDVQRPAFHEAFQRRFGFPPRPGDDFVLLQLMRGAEDSVTNTMLAKLVKASPVGRPSVTSFKQDVKKFRDWDPDTTLEVIEDFALEREGIYEPLDPGKLPTALRVLSDRTALERARLPTKTIVLLKTFESEWSRLAARASGQDRRGRAAIAFEAVDTVAEQADRREAEDTVAEQRETLWYGLAVLHHVATEAAGDGSSP
jgi:hypothetical protein